MGLINRVPIVQQVADNLRAYITSGAVVVGEKLPTEMRLCEDFGVGRGTVREALRILQTSGYVDMLPGRGAFAARITEEDTEDVFGWLAQNEIELKDCIEVRSALEPLAIRLAVQRCTDADIEEIQLVHDAFLKSVSEGDVQGMSTGDELFHTIIIKKSGNQLLLSMSDKVNEFIRAFRSKTFRVRQNAMNSIQPHNNIMRALQERDVTAAELYMKRHIEMILEDLESNIHK